MPSYFLSATNNATNVAVSFQVTDSTISGSANMQGVCNAGGGYGEEYVNAIAGVVNTDGTFTAGYSATGDNAQTLEIRGTVPKEANGKWTGTFTFTSPGSANICAASYESAVTAAAFPSVIGTFSGSGLLSDGALGSGSSIPAGTVYSLSATLTQDAASPETLTGSIQTTGFPCFTHGATTAIPNSSTTSNVLVLNLVMDDGATMLLVSTVNDTTSSQIAVPAIYIRGDACEGNYYFDREAAQSTSSLLLNK